MAVESPPIPQTQTAPSIPKLNYEDFLVWALKQEGHFEWVNGEVVSYRSVSPLHQKLVVFLSSLLKLFVNLMGLGEIYTGPAQLKLPNGSGREPDVFFLSRARASQERANRIDGPADLVIEVISDDSVTMDREDKFYEYEAAGVLEYWIIDPRPHRRRAYFYQLNEQGQYQPTPLNADGVYHSRALPSFWLKAEWVIGPEFPNPLVKLIEVVGVDNYARLLSQAQIADQQ